MTAMALSLDLVRAAMIFFAILFYAIGCYAFYRLGWNQGSTIMSSEMTILFRRTFQPDDTLILLSENEWKAKLLMKLGQMEPKIMGRTPPSDTPNKTISQDEKIIESLYSAQLTIVFIEKEGEK